MFAGQDNRLFDPLAMDAPGANVCQLAAVEVCAGLWGRTLAAATVEPALAASALPPTLRAMIGRQLFLGGEFLGRLEVGPSGLLVRPCVLSDVRGVSPDPLRWRYLLDVPAPDRNVVLPIPAADGLHVRHAPEPFAPWAGVSPLASSGLDPTYPDHFLCYGPLRA